VVFGDSVVIGEAVVVIGEAKIEIGSEERFGIVCVSERIVFFFGLNALFTPMFQKVTILAPFKKKDILTP